jgi:hypothetical protein
MGCGEPRNEVSLRRTSFGAWAADMKKFRFTVSALVVAVALMAAWPAVAAIGLEDARLVVAPDGVLFVIHDGVRYRVTPRQMSAAELGAIPEGPTLPVGLLAPPPVAAPAPEPTTVRPTAAQGLTREAPIPLGWTCSCTIDRGGAISQFDIAVVRVLRDAQPMIQAANRFNKPPREGAVYLGVLLDIKYISGPQDQAYTIAESDFRAAASDAKLRDPSELLGFSQPVAPAGAIPGSTSSRLRADVYPGSTLRGWVFFEIPVAETATLAWEFSFLGERAVWFALQ